PEPSGAPASQLRVDLFLHRRIVPLVVRAGPVEPLVEHDEVADLRQVEQRLPLVPASNLVDPQKLVAARADSVALGLGDAPASMVGERKPPFADNRIDDDLIHTSDSKPMLLRLSPAAPLAPFVECLWLNERGPLPHRHAAMRRLRWPPHPLPSTRCFRTCG